MIDRLDLSSPDLVNQNLEKLAELFPNCVTEGPDGKVVDFDLLKQELNHDVVEGATERYRLEWPGKRQAMVNANLPTTKTLRPVQEDSVDFDNTKNLYIEGDNLEVLKILQESYLGKIKMIYIDPPYNTGKDFVYKDNFTQDSDEYKEESGQTDEYNRRLVPNPDNSGRYHSDWLSMMYPRLKLARNLLTADGVIFISIGEDEVHNLRKICDEIFGEGAFQTEVTWQKRYTRSNNTVEFTTVVESILVYSKTAEFEVNLLPRTGEADGRYTNPDDDPRGPWKGASFLNPATPSQRPNLCYPITNPFTKEVTLPSSNAWRRSREEYERLAREDLLYWGKNGRAKVPVVKRFLSEARGLTPTNFWDHKYSGNTDEGTKELEDLFGMKVFDFPKPSLLLKRVLEHSVSTDSLVLDFFSGTGGLAQAVSEFNAEHASRVRYILVQIPESTASMREVYDAGFETISAIGKHRLRLVAEKLSGQKAKLDLGFKVYRVDESNMEGVYYQPQTIGQENMDLFTSHIKVGRTSEDLLTQVLIDWGLPLTLKTKKAVVEGKEVYKVAGDSLYACFDDGLGESFAKAVANEKPLRLVVKDSAFESDTAKVNVQQLLKQLSPNTELKVI